MIQQEQKKEKQEQKQRDNREVRNHSYILSAFNLCISYASPERFVFEKVVPFIYLIGMFEYVLITALNFDYSDNVF